LDLTSPLYTQLRLWTFARFFWICLVARHAQDEDERDAAYGFFMNLVRNLYAGDTALLFAD
jgi:hypothetical protein